jgi:hypothetical protein
VVTQLPGQPDVDLLPESEGAPPAG